MKEYESQNIRNIALLGHASKGKTTIAEAMINISGATERLGKVLEGNTVMDFDREEKARKFSISSAVAPIEYKDKKINIIDTPGLFDFESGAAEGTRAADTALIVVSARSGLAVGSEKAFKNATTANMSKIFVATKMDHERADFFKSMNEIIAKFGTSVCPVVIPVINSGEVVAYYNLLTDKTFAYDGTKKSEVNPNPSDVPRFEAVKEVFNEAVAGADDELMEKFFDGQPLTTEDKIKGLKIGVANGSIIPLFACSGLEGTAVDMILDFVADVCPAPKSEFCADKNGEPVELAPDKNGEPIAICFKTIADPFIGRLSYIKVVSGTVKAGMTVYNPRTEKEEKAGKIVTMFGANQTDCDEIPAGDIGAVVKLGGFLTGDTLCTSSFAVTLNGVATSKPQFAMAVMPKDKGDEEKIASGIMKLTEEDPCLKFELNTETNQQILKGLGEQHLDVAMSKLKSKFGVEATLEAPKVAYRETITKKVSAQGRHKKQSGGHGQFGDVFIEFEPNMIDEFEFAERVVGGAVPKNFFPAVEKGLRECMQNGVLAGYPMVGVKATLYDGSYHPVDSSEMSFKMAANLAFKEGIPKANPVILEPIGTLSVTCNDEAMGDIIGEINKRRGRVLGMSPNQSGMQDIMAEVPMGEMATFSTAIRQITQGRGYYDMELARYDKVPEHIAQKIIESAK